MKYLVIEKEVFIKKLILITNSISLGGLTKSLFLTLDMLSSNYEITILCMNSDKAYQSELKKRNINLIIHQDIPKLSYFSGGLKLISRTLFQELFNLKRFVIKTREFLEGKKYDICIVYSLVLFPVVKSINIDGPKIIYLHETLKKNMISKIITRYIEINYDGILSISKSELSLFNKSINKEVISDTYLRDNKLSNLKDDKRILYMGGTDPIKGFFQVISIAKHIPNGWKILLTGKIDYNPKIRFLFHPILKLKYSYYLKRMNSDKIDIIGPINDISLVIDKISFGIFPSTYSHQPRPILELGFFKKTAILSNFKETNFFYQDNFNVLNFIHNNKRDLLKKINKLINDEELMFSLGQKNYFMSQMFHNYFTEKVRLNEFLQLFKTN